MEKETMSLVNADKDRCKGLWTRDRERQRQRETETERDRDRERERQRQRQRETGRETYERVVAGI